MTKGRHSTCSCGRQVSVLRYQDGKKTCEYCAPLNLSGTFLRRMEGEARYYEKDLIQKYNKDGTLNETFKEVYGEGRNA